MFYSIVQRYNKWKLRNNNFTVFSNDCWGAEVYHYYDLAYNTPFIGLFMMAPCYIKFLKNPDFYLNMDLKFTKQSKYPEIDIIKQRNEKDFPIGILGDIELHFLHYENEAEAIEKWTRRKQRIFYDNLFIKFDAGKDGATDELVKEFDALPYKNKICFGNKKTDNIESYVYCPDWEKDGAKMFNKSIKRFKISKWLNGEGLVKK